MLADVEECPEDSGNQGEVLIVLMELSSSQSWH